MEKKVWFITGSSRGLGRSIARAALERGDVVIGTSRNGTSDLPASDRLHMVALDVTNAAQIRDAVAKAHALHGRLDVVLNNAGFGLLGAIEDSSADEVEDVFAVNFFGPLHVIQAALPLLRAQGTGHIVNVASIAGIAPGAGSGVYAAAKCALVGLTDSLAQEVAPLGIRATVVAPGAFRTEFLSDSSIKLTATRGDAYAASVGKMLGAFEAMAGKQLGDPDRAARAFLALVDAPNPPVRLLLGGDALKRTRSTLANFEREMAAWEATTTSTDFPADA